MISKINFQNISQNIYNLSKSQKILSFKGNSFEGLPRCDNFNFGPNDAEISEILDKQIFHFDTFDKKHYDCTLKDYLQNSLISTRKIYNAMKMYHCTYSKETAQKIIEEGLDWTKTAVVRCGPGVYFSPNAQDAKIQTTGGAIISGKYIGNKNEHPVFAQRFYDAIISNEELSKQLKSANRAEKFKILNKYCHDFLQNEMGIDFLYASTGYASGAYVVLNNNCMKLSPYDF